MTTLTTEQAQQIEEALEDIVRVFKFETGTPVEALTTIRAARAQEQEPVWNVEECDRVVKTLRYIQGIAERGFGRAMREDETIEQFVLGYVKQLEAAPVRTKDLTPYEITALIRDGAAGGGWQGFAQRVIAKFKEKNK